jgi:hypothetical protein
VWDHQGGHNRVVDLFGPPSTRTSCSTIIKTTLELRNLFLTLNVYITLLLSCALLAKITAKKVGERRTCADTLFPKKGVRCE